MRSVTWFVVLVVVAVLALVVSSAWAATIDVSVARNITSTGGVNGYYERDPELLVASSGTWYLVYARSQTEFTAGGNPDGLKYDTYYQTSTDNGATWGAAVKVLDAAAIGTTSTFRSATVCEADGKIWVIGADCQNSEGDVYANTYAGGSWSGQSMIFDGTWNTGGFHVDAVTEGDNVRLFYGIQNESKGVGFIKYDGDTDSWDAAVTEIGTTAGWQIPRVIKEGSTYYLVSTNWDHILFTSTTTPDVVPWPAATEVANAPMGGAASDPCVLKYGASGGTDDLIIFHAPWYADDSQPEEYVYSTDGGTTWSGSTPFTDARHTVGSSWDMMPRAYMKDASTVMSFFGMEKRGAARCQADIVVTDWSTTATVGNAHYTTVQDGIDNASPNDIVAVAAGLYPERLAVAKSIDLRGAQYSVDPTPTGARTNTAAESTIDITGLGVMNPNVAVEIPNGVTHVTVAGFTIKGSQTFHYADESNVRCWDDNVTIADNIMEGYLGVLCKGADTQVVSRNRMVVNKNGVVVQPNPGMNVTLSGNRFSLGTLPAGDEAAMYVAGCSHVQVLGNTATGFVNSNAIGGSGVTDITISGNTFSGNKKGVNFWGTTTFVTVSNNDITGHSGAGINIKGQDITITGNRVTGNGTGVDIDYNVIPTQRVAVSGNQISGNTGLGLKVGASVTETVNASGNWWGSTDAAAVRAAANAGVGADYSPWLGGGTPLSPGFDGDYSTLWVDGDSPRVGTTGYIQEGVDLVSGSTLNVLDGTYDETITFGPAFATSGLVIDGATSSLPVVNGGVRFQNTGALTGITLRDLYLKGTVAGQNRVIANNNTGALYDFGLDGCVLDGENVADRCGVAGNLYGGALTITGCEFKNLLGFAVMDIDSSSDYSPYGGNGLPFTTVTFSGNGVHDCNGTVSLRGHHPTKTTQVNVHDNTFTSIGGNQGQAGEQWAAIEVNHAVALSFHGNVIDDVICGIWGEGQAVQLWDVGTIDMHGNSFTGCYQGLYVFGGEAGGDYGGPYAIPAGAVSYNNISGNTEYGLRVQDTATGGPLDAEMNWWGDASGPEVAKGTGDKVIGNVDADPWIGKSGGENVVCDPDPLTLKIGSTTGQVAVKYLGGGSGLVFGYSVTVSWDAGKVNLTGITEGGLLRDAVPPNGTFFFVYGTGNTRTIDCSILGSLVHPGVTGPGTMFTLNFSAVGYGESPVDVTILAFRDKKNDPLSGFYEDDGLITVDITNPVVTDVHIANLTLSHTDDYAKDTDDLELTATVTDDYPLTAADITADLSLLLSGGGTAVPAESYIAPTATWTLALADADLTTPDGSKSVTVTAEDGLGNTGTGSDAITVDNTLPGSVEGFAAAPGYQKVHLSWTDASGKDTNYYGVIVRYDAWGDYPEYDMAAPGYPATYAAGDGTAFTGTGTVATHVIVPPDIHYYSAFVHDMALNYGPVTSAGQDRATNYWLGDVASGFGVWGYDGLVSDNDINFLGGQYGQVPTGDFNRCDVGPSDDHSRLGIPQPNDFINFEDLMMFAMNYGAVSPAGRIVPFLAGPGEGELALSLEELVRSPEGEVQVALRLGGNVGDVKGISTVVTYDASQLEFVSARLSDAMSSPLAEMFFWSGLEDGKVLVDLAVLGTDVAIGGSGDVAVLTFRALDGEYALGFGEALIRGVENDELTADLEGLESRPEVPAVFRLSQNVPNPFNPKTTVSYEVPQVCEVTIRVYDVTGRLVTTLVDGTVEPGRYAATWDGRSDAGEAVGSGVYFCVMETPEYRAAHKMMLLK